MNLVDEEHVPLFELATIAARSPARSIAGPEVCDVDVQLARDDVRERGLAQPRRPRKENVIENLAALAGGLDRHARIFLRRSWPTNSARDVGAATGRDCDLRDRSRARRSAHLSQLHLCFATNAVLLTFRQAAPPTISELWFPDPPTSFIRITESTARWASFGFTPDSPMRKPRRPIAVVLLPQLRWRRPDWPPNL